MRLCAFGDSFVAGIGDAEGLGWVGRICAAARRRGGDVTCYNLGIRGNTTADIAARWQTEAARRLPQGEGGLLFSFGVNDCVRGVARGDSLAAAKQMLSAARAHYPVLMVGPPPVDDDILNAMIGALSAGLQDLCRSLDIPYLGVFPDLLTDPCWRREVTAGDGSHPAAQGYGRLAKLVEAWPSWLAWGRS